MGIEDIGASKAHRAKSGNTMVTSGHFFNLAFITAIVDHLSPVLSATQCKTPEFRRHTCWTLSFPSGKIECVFNNYLCDEQLNE